jgi:hypothetical protein
VLGQITVCIFPAIANEDANVMALVDSEIFQRHQYCFKYISADGSWKGLAGVGMGVINHTELEFLEINLTKNSILLLHAIHSLSFGGFFKEKPDSTLVVKICSKNS